MTENEAKVLAAYEALIRECKRIAENVWNADLEAAGMEPSARLVFLKEVTATHLIGTEKRGIVVSIPADPAAPPVKPFGKDKGTPLTALSGIDLQSALDWAMERPDRSAKFADFLVDAVNELAQRDAKAHAIQTQPLSETPLALVEASDAPDRL